MSEARLLLISGPAGAGKSELAELWASTRPYRCARVSMDATWELIKSGRALAVEGWNDESQRQHQLTMDNVAALIQNFLKHEISVVVDDVVFPAWPDSGLPAYERRLPGVDLTMVVLMPGWDVIRRRNAERDGLDNLPEQMLRKIYDDMSGWNEQSAVPLIDNSDMSIEQTLAEVERLVR